MTTTKALILGAGLGTRLRPLTDRIPKCLVDIGGRPLLDYHVCSLQEAGVSEAVINTHHFADAVQSYIEEVNRRSSFQLREFYEKELLGSAGTVAANAELADGACEIVIDYGDNLTAIDYGEVIEFHRSHTDPVTMVLFHSATPQACGIAEVNDDGLILGFEEKPKHPKGDLANAGVYIVSPEAYLEMGSKDAHDLAHDVLPDFVGRMRGFVHSGYHRDIGTLDSLERARVDVASGLLSGAVAPGRE